MKSLKRENLKTMVGFRLVKLVVEANECKGAIVVELESGNLCQIHCRAVVLASGGYSQIYQETTNPVTSTGDGICSAFGVGAVIQDPEFVQFHPTALFLAGAPRFLISEAVRGEGAILRNADGDAFMKSVHSMAELAPRDVVSRAIAREMIRHDEACVFLDLSHLNSEKIYKRFPTIAACCKRFGLDLAKQWIPVRPAAHYTMGGVKTDLWGQTNISRLYACGEVASTGVHGANRLASNSLLEALVFGQRVAESISGLGEGSDAELQADRELRSSPDLDYGDVIRTIRSIMWRRVGVFRNESSLLKVKKRLLEWWHLPMPDWGYGVASDDMRVLITNALLVTEGALRRKESRGAHHRDDFASRDDENFKHHTLLKREELFS
jgi:L-aspartate oxidase